MKKTENMQLADNLTLNTVQLTRDRLLSQLESNSASDISVNLSTVTGFDTAGLALLIDLKRIFKAKAGKVRFVDVPESIKNLAIFYEVEEIFN